MISHFSALNKAAIGLFILVGIFFASVEKTNAQDIITPMVEQIAKLELYLQEAKKGYSIAQEGLTTIGNIKKGEFDIHSLFFNSLQNVNPEIKNWGRVGDIIAMQVQILLGCITSIKQFSSSRSFSPGDLSYLSAVYSNLKDLTLADIDELADLVTDGTWQMNDAERMSRIDQLYLRVSEKYVFLRSFSNRASLEGQHRIQEATDLQNIEKLFQP